MKPNQYESLHLYVQLSCKHMFSLNFLDKFIEDQQVKQLFHLYAAPNVNNH